MGARRPCWFIKVVNERSISSFDPESMDRGWTLLLSHLTISLCQFCECVPDNGTLAVQYTRSTFTKLEGVTTTALSITGVPSVCVGCVCVGGCRVWVCVGVG